MTASTDLRQSAVEGLDIGGAAGATIETTYLRRTQEIVAVNRNDLEDILEFDGMSAAFSAFGMFLLSGALWLGVEKAFDGGWANHSGILGVCVIATACGAVFLAAGGYLWWRKRGRIERIFHETREVAAR